MSTSIICIGAAMVDELFFCQQTALEGTSNPAYLHKATGGVVCNIAQHLGLLQIPVQFITVIGNDADGNWLEKVCKKRGVGSEYFLIADEPTGKYIAILQPDGSLFTAACADISSKYITCEFLHQHEAILQKALVIIGDTNISIQALEWLSEFSFKNNIKLIIEPVSVEKAKKLSAINLKGIFMLTPNEDELTSLCIKQYNDPDKCVEELLLRGVKHVWLRKGGKGSVMYNKNGAIQLDTKQIKILDSTGAGDAALSGWVAAHHHGWDEMKCLQAGHSLAYEVLQVKGAIIEALTGNTFLQLIQKYYSDAK